MTTEPFRKLLKENREEFQSTISNLTEDNTEEFVATMMPSVEKQYCRRSKKMPTKS